MEYKKFVPGKGQMAKVAYGMAGTAVSFIPLSFVPLDWEIPNVPEPLNDIGFDLGLVAAGIGFVGAAAAEKASRMRLWWLGIGFGGLLFLLPRLYQFTTLQQAKAGTLGTRGLQISPMTGKTAALSGPARARGFGTYRASPPTTIPQNVFLA